MAVKKKTELGPKAKLMKKNVDQLKRQAKKLKIQGYSTKKKEQLVNSIMMAEARAKRKPGTKRKTAAKKPAAVKSVTTRVTMKGKAPRRRMAAPRRRMNKPMMRDVAYAQFNDFGYKELREASDLLRLYSLGAVSRLASDYFSGPYGISVGFNNMSGNVFLVDEDFNVLMNTGGQLDLFITTPYSGEEGFYDDLMEMYNELDPEDQEYLDSLK